MCVNCLRISVTDRCNLRCVYCRPQNDFDFIDRAEILTFEEIHHLARLFVRCGIDRIRLTGGEPLVRRNMPSLVARLAATEGINDLALTTNGVLLEPMADDLRAAGLDRVNISLDSMEAENYRAVTGRNCLSRVLRGIQKAVEVGLQPVKINAVILRTANTSQIVPLARLSMDLPVTVRFIEYCPTCEDTEPASDYVPCTEVRRVIEKTLGRLSDALTGLGSGPAHYFKIAGAAGAIGFIAGRSTTFCRSCTRIRLTSDGRIKPCLYARDDYDVKKFIRAGASDEQILRFLAEIMVRKHGVSRVGAFAEEFSMRRVGG